MDAAEFFNDLLACIASAAMRHGLRTHASSQLLYQ